MLIVPSDALHPRRADEHFRAEADAARAAGHQVGLIDHDALAAGNADHAVARLPAGDTPAVYRGWMLTAAAYAGFEAAVATRGITLRTSAEQYQRGHELPGWYSALEALTPTSTWTNGDGRAAFDAARTALGSGPAVLRDYTKSMKHYWAEAAFIPDLTDGTTAWSIAHRMRELRGDDFTGGYVLRRFEPFTGAETRTWWLHGTCQMITAHPDTPDQPPPPDLPTAHLATAIAKLDLPFVTVDLARRTDGQWRVIELGDGQVSDRPTTVPADAFIAGVSNK